MAPSPSKTPCDTRSPKALQSTSSLPHRFPFPPRRPMPHHARSQVCASPRQRPIDRRPRHQTSVAHMLHARQRLSPKRFAVIHAAIPGKITAGFCQRKPFCTAVCPLPPARNEMRDPCLRPRQGDCENRFYGTPAQPDPLPPSDRWLSHARPAPLDPYRAATHTHCPY
jgi:hypothetical protein